MLSLCSPSLLAPALLQYFSLLVGANFCSSSSYTFVREITRTRKQFSATDISCGVSLGYCSVHALAIAILEQCPTSSRRNRLSPLARDRFAKTLRQLHRLLADIPTRVQTLEALAQQRSRGDSPDLILVQRRCAHNDLLNKS